MSHNKRLLLSTGLLIGALTSSNVYAVNCSTSYYCYRSMTPGPAPETSEVLARRTADANNRVAQANQRATPQRRTNTAPPQAAQPGMTLEQRRAEALRREQEQQRAVAERRRLAQQQEQQRLAQLQQQRAQQQRAQPQPAAAGNNAQAAERQRLIEAQRRAHQAEQARLATDRNAIRQAIINRRTQGQPAARPAAPAPRAPVAATSGNQNCTTIGRKIDELNRQAVVRSRERAYDEAQRLFRAVAQLKQEGKSNNCPGME